MTENVLPHHDAVAPRARVNGGPLRVAFFGQLSPLKGIEVFLRAARRLERTGLPITFRIYGSSESQPSSFQDRVRAMLDALPSNVSYKGPYRNSDVLPLMAKNDVVVVPSLWWENSPLVIREAEAAGCVVIGTDIGGIKEKVEALDRGETFDYNDADELADKLVELQSF